MGSVNKILKMTESKKQRTKGFAICCVVSEMAVIEKKYVAFIFKLFKKGVHDSFLSWPLYHDK